MAQYNYRQEVTPDNFVEGSLEATDEEDARRQLRDEYGGTTVRLEDASASDDEDGDGDDEVVETEDDAPFAGPDNPTTDLPTGHGREGTDQSSFQQGSGQQEPQVHPADSPVPPADESDSGSHNGPA